MTAKIILGPWSGSNIMRQVERPFFSQYEGLPDLAQIERWRKEAKLPARFADEAGDKPCDSGDAA